MSSNDEKHPPNQVTITLVFTVFIAVFGTWFPMGFDTTALNGPQTIAVRWIRSVHCDRLGSFPANYTLSNMTDDRSLWCEPISESTDSFMLINNPRLNTIWTICSAMTNFGALCTVALTAVSVDYIGIKRTLLLSAGIRIIGSAICCLSDIAASYEMLIIARFLFGAASGFIAATPLYLSELSPIKIRGAIGTLPTILAIIGMISATVLALPQILGNAKGWSILLSLQSVPSIILLLFLPCCPEGPRRLYITLQLKTEAERALVWLRRTSDVTAELAEMQEEADKEVSKSSKKAMPVKTLLKDPFYRKVLVIALAPTFAQQFSGYSCVALYSTSIFRNVGFTQLNSVYASIGIWVTYLIFSLLSMALVDRMGRKTLLLLSHCGISLSLGLFVAFMVMTRYGFFWTQFASAGCMVLFIMMFAIGSASVPWILLTELFTQEARSPAMTTAAVIRRVAATLSTMTFSLLVAVTQEYTFVFFLACVVLATVHVFWNLPETKGKTFEEIQTDLRKRLGHQQ